MKELPSPKSRSEADGQGDVGGKKPLPEREIPSKTIESGKSETGFVVDRLVLFRSLFRTYVFLFFVCVFVCLFVFVCFCGHNTPSCWWRSKSFAETTATDTLLAQSTRE